MTGLIRFLIIWKWLTFFRATVYILTTHVTLDRHLASRVTAAKILAAPLVCTSRMINTLGYLPTDSDAMFGCLHTPQEIDNTLTRLLNSAGLMTTGHVVYGSIA